MSNNNQEQSNEPMGEERAEEERQLEGDEEDAEIIEMMQIEQEIIQEQDEVIEENSQRMVARQEQLQEGEEQGPSQYQNKVKNPVSPYMMFVKSWKQRNPGEKFNMSGLGELWRNMTMVEKHPFEEEYKAKRKQFEQYQTNILINDPTPNHSDQPNHHRTLFPLHRIKSIMKQDTYYMAKAESVLAMAKATEYFGEYLLEEVKKINQGKNRVDHKHLFNCINVANHRTLSFLECLIQEYNKDEHEGHHKDKIKQDKQPNTIHNEGEGKKEHQTAIFQEEKKKKNTNTTFKPKVLPPGQSSLEFFFKK